MRHGLKGPRRGAWALLGALVGAVILGAVVGGASTPSRAADCPPETPAPTRPIITVAGASVGHAPSKGGPTGGRVEVKKGNEYFVADGSAEGGLQVWAGAKQGSHDLALWAQAKREGSPIVAACSAGVG